MRVALFLTGCLVSSIAVSAEKTYDVVYGGTSGGVAAAVQVARLGVFKYIETFYNPVRIHQTLGYLSPNQYEAEHAPAVAA